MMTKHKMNKNILKFIKTIYSSSVVCMSISTADLSVFVLVSLSSIVETISIFSLVKLDSGTISF